MPLINAHTHSHSHAHRHAHAVTRGHVRPGVVSPFSPSHIHLFHLSFFPVARSVSHAITQAAPWGEPSPVALLDAIIIPSAGSVFPDCALGLSLQGAYSGEGRVEETRAGGRLSFRDAGRGKGRRFVFLAAAHPVLSGGAQSRTNELRLAH